MRIVTLVAVTLLSTRALAEDAIDVPPSSRFFFGFGLGVGTRDYGDDTAAESVVSVIAGQPIGASLQLVEYGDSIESLSNAPPVLRKTFALLVGVRWTPFAPQRKPSQARIRVSRFSDSAALNVALLAGVEDRSVITYQMDMKENSSEWAAVTALAIGYTPIQGYDWAFGMELRARIAVYGEANEVAYGGQFVLCVMR